MRRNRNQGRWRASVGITIAIMLVAALTSAAAADDTEVAREPAVGTEPSPLGEHGSGPRLRGELPASLCRGLLGPDDARLARWKVTSWRLQRCMRLNQIQVIGTHNSYKLLPEPGLFTALATFDQTLADSIEYEHSPLAEQFSDEGVRQIELDVFADPEGGLYADRPILDALGLDNVTPPELLEPGFKTLHIQDVDFASSCLTFVSCLEQVNAWSSANRNHLPIVILVELKSESIPDPLDLGFVTPLAIGPDDLDELDAEIRSVFDERQIISPDDVRGDYATLEEAVLAGRWPTLAQSKGKVMFLMDNAGTARTDYIDGRPSLEGRVLFTNSTPGNPDAAFVKMNEPRGNEDAIAELVADGYIVRTRADSPTDEARSGSTERREAALASGAQWVSTDYPVPGRSPWSDYEALIPGGQPARCNPINAGPRCEASKLERIRPS